MSEKNIGQISYSKPKPLYTDERRTNRDISDEWESTKEYKKTIDELNRTSDQDIDDVMAYSQSRAK